LTFDYPGYQLKFIQKDACRDTSKHLFTLIYKFFSPVTKYHYIIKADYHEGDIFAVKFYCKKDRRSNYKYSKTVNRGDLGNIMISCFSVLPRIMQFYPNASFAFIGAPSVDLKTKNKEKRPFTKRFAVYRYIASTIIGTKTFEHIEYEKVSGYMLINKLNEDIPGKETEFTSMFIETYSSLYEPL